MKVSLPNFQTVFLTFFGLMIAGTGSLQGYDSHHPDPMAILTGHVRHVRHKTILSEKQNTSRKRVQPWRMYRRSKESKYIIKPEPYSIASQKADPELLGPQRTLADVPTSIASEAEKAAARPPASAVPAGHETSGGMTRSACIDLIGQEKFDSYVQKYGGEKGALYRCLILKRTRG